jgi:hypothetical membrane protein
VLLSSAAAPLLLVGGWTAAAARQPAGYDQTLKTISSLAAVGAADRWLMTAALFGTGICHLVTAAGLRPVAPGGRLLLAAGGVATVLVAAFPLPREGSSPAHTISAGFAFLALAAWPLLGFRRAPGTPHALRPVGSIAAGVVLLVLVGWFAVAMASGIRVGLAERVAAGAQTTWPFVVALSTRIR